jgi:hypothetical protein
MRIKLTSALLAMVGVAGVSLATAELKRTAPAKVDLTGLWKLNEEQSDDPHKTVARKREDSASGGYSRGGRRRGGATIDVGDILGGIGGTIGGGTVGGTVGRGGGGGGGQSDRPEGDPEPAKMKMPLDSFLATREEFEIKQQPDTVSVNTLEETSTCKTGAATKVKVPNGDQMDQRCGWDGGTWVTELKSEDGVTRTNRYELRKNGQQLVMVSEIKGGHTQLAGLKLKRVYDRIVME